jgi:hypothetical protein
MLLFITLLVLIIAYYAVTEATKTSRFLRYLIHYPFRVVVTFLTVGFFALCFMFLVYGPFMLLINGLFSFEYGLFSDKIDTERITNFHAKWYWLIVFGLTSVVLVRNFIETEKEQNK